MPDDFRVSEVNLGQAFVGFLWTILYTDISRKVFDADSSLLQGWVSIHLIKWLYVVVSLIWVIGLVHLFWGWYARLHILENSYANPPDVAEFAHRARVVFLWGMLVVACVAGFVMATYAIFPQAGINAFEAAFAALMWPSWMISVFVAVYDRIENR